MFGTSRHLRSQLAEPDGTLEAAVCGHPSIAQTRREQLPPLRLPIAKQAHGIPGADVLGAVRILVLNGVLDLPESVWCL
jgi:hypothetical protein